jgi:putative FmdB family regulatory protein
MPLYDYACTRCGRVREVRHGFDETYQTPCEACGAPLRRVFNAAPVLFKGSGFYVTDSRRPAGRKDEKPKAEPAAEAGTTKAAEPAGKSDAKGGAAPGESAA